MCTKRFNSKLCLWIITIVLSSVSQATLSYQAKADNGSGNINTDQDLIIDEQIVPAEERNVAADDEILFLPLIFSPLLPPEPPILNSPQTTGFTLPGVYMISWNYVDSASEYILEEDGNPQFNNPKLVYQGPNLFWFAASKPCGVPFYYRVKAINSSGVSSWSNMQSVLTQLQFTYVPPIGGFQNLSGKVCDVNPSEFNIATFIYVQNQWWTKPQWNRPIESIQNDGTWSVDITTGGTDPAATRIAVFLLPNGTTPPLCGVPVAHCLFLPNQVLSYPHIIVAR